VDTLINNQPTQPASSVTSLGYIRNNAQVRYVSERFAMKDCPPAATAGLPYAVAKAALTMYSKGLAHEVGPHVVRASQHPLPQNQEGDGKKKQVTATTTRPQHTGLDIPFHLRR
jgi:hypothetical protein